MICRDCHNPIYDLERYNIPAIKYGEKHYLHAACAIARGYEFLSRLKVWQLECLPFGLLKKAGLLTHVESLIKTKRYSGGC